MLNFHLVIIFLVAVTAVHCLDRPHIITIIVDDAGWNDFSLHGSSQIPTPNIDALSYNGASLFRHYSMHICTPSRSALLTGHHPIKLGLQGNAFQAGEPSALPLNVPTLANKLLDLGYNTHLVGKWHLGHQFRNVTPCERGFQTYLGHWNGFCNYRSFFLQDTPVLGGNGFDLHHCYKPAYEYSDGKTYATDLYTDEVIRIINNHDASTPMFMSFNHLAPHADQFGRIEPRNKTLASQRFNYISLESRRYYADVITDIDRSLGQVMRALQSKDMLRDSIILFLSDNGAQTYGLFQNYGSNWPFRGQKYTMYDGGTRTVGILWSPLLCDRCKKVIDENLIHIVDWFPTLYAAAGGNVKDLDGIDGVNHWPRFSTNSEYPPRDAVLLNYDEKENYGAIITPDGRFKLTQGSYKFGIYDTHTGDSGRDASVPAYNISAVLASDTNQAIASVTDTELALREEDCVRIRSGLEITPQCGDQGRELLLCTAFGGYCLFDLYNDPCELHDVHTTYPDVFASLKASYERYKLEALPQISTQPTRPASDPCHCNKTWFTWDEPTNQLKCPTKYTSFCIG